MSDIIRRIEKAHLIAHTTLQCIQHSLISELKDIVIYMNPLYSPTFSAWIDIRLVLVYSICSPLQHTKDTYSQQSYLLNMHKFCQKLRLSQFNLLLISVPLNTRLSITWYIQASQSILMRILLNRYRVAVDELPM